MQCGQRTLQRPPLPAWGPIVRNTARRGVMRVGLWRRRVCLAAPVGTSGGGGSVRRLLSGYRVQFTYSRGGPAPGARRRGGAASLRPAAAGRGAAHCSTFMSHWPYSRRVGAGRRAGRRPRRPALSSRRPRPHPPASRGPSAPSSRAAWRAGRCGPGAPRPPAWWRRRRAASRQRTAPPPLSFASTTSFDSGILNTHCVHLARSVYSCFDAEQQGGATALRIMTPSTNICRDVSRNMRITVMPGRNWAERRWWPNRSGRGREGGAA